MKCRHIVGWMYDYDNSNTLTFEDLKEINTFKDLWELEYLRSIYEKIIEAISGFLVKEKEDD